MYTRLARSPLAPVGAARRSYARAALVLVAGALALALAGCGSGGGTHGATLVVNSLQDTAEPPAGTLTLRAALQQAAPADSITFAPVLDGQTIQLSLVGEAHSTLKGETYAGMSFTGYQDRDYGASALYVAKSVKIDASGLPHGITLNWNGGDASRARVLAVYGNLTMTNVTVTGGHSYAEAIAGGTQPYTLARGGGLAVWGTATLRRCTIAGNRCTGDPAASRDRGTYGGGIYANGLNLQDCVVSGNSVLGYGAAGGGIYSVGGADNTGGRGNDTTLARCTVSGNRTTAQHSYGGGIFTLSGGPNNLATMHLVNCTIARNLVEDNPTIQNVGQFYFRGGGVYMGGGSLEVVGCTIAENEVTGEPAMFSLKPNMGGGGVCATIGNAHTVENVTLQGSVVAGNKLRGAPEDWYAGSLLNFYSGGYNLVGVLDFSQILAPVPDWMDLSRKHWPKVGDQEGVSLAQALDAAGAQRSTSVLSAGTDAGQPAVLWYPPAGLALDRIPERAYSVQYVAAGYTGFGQTTDDFLNYVLLQARQRYGSTLGSDFGTSFGDLTGLTWYGPAVTWPTNSANGPWIAFWHNLDTEIGGRLGMAGLGDDFWGSFSTGPLGQNLRVAVTGTAVQYRLASSDQRGRGRPSGRMGDVGAIEQ